MIGKPDCSPDDLARFLGLEPIADVIKRLVWLGLLDDTPVTVERGANVDVLVDLMLKKLSYEPGERDMIIVHDEIVTRFPQGTEKRSSTLVMEGSSDGDSAMSRAVSLPVAIACRLILEGEIDLSGVHMPTLPEIYQPVLSELETLGFDFKHRTELVTTLKLSARSSFRR